MIEAMKYRPLEKDTALNPLRLPGFMQQKVGPNM